MSRIELTLALMVAVAVTAPVAYGLAAFWLVTARVGWLWRAAPLALMLAALAPLGAYELVAVFGTQALVVVVAVAAARWKTGRRVPRASQRWRFTLREMLTMVLLLAAVMAIARHAAPGTEATLGTAVEWWRWIATGAIFGVVSCSAIWLVCGRMAWYARLLVFILAVSLGSCLEQLEILRALLAAVSSSPPILPYDLVYLVVDGHAIATALCLWLTRASGWAWWERDDQVRSNEYATDNDRTSSHGSRWPTRLIMLPPAMLLTAWLLSTLYVGLSSRANLNHPLGYRVLFWHSLVNVVALLVIVAGGWKWWRQLGAQTAATEPGPPGRSFAKLRRPRIRLWTARVLLAELVIFGTLLVGFAYWTLLPPKAPPSPALPNPNGFDLLAQATGEMNWIGVPRGYDFETGSLETGRVLLSDNATLLATTRRGLAMPAQLPLEYASTATNTTLMGVQNFRMLARMLDLEARVAIADGHHERAMNCYLDQLRLADATGRGGILIPVLIGTAMQNMAISGIAAHLDDWSDAQLIRACGELAAFNENCEPLEAVIARDRTWERLANGWLGRLEFVITRALYGTTYDTHYFDLVRNRVEALSQLLIAEAAIRRFVRDTGAPPGGAFGSGATVSKTAPVDPFGDGPLVYRRSAESYLLYSVGGNRRDDGGQRVTMMEAVNERKGDLFLDAPVDIDIDDSGNQVLVIEEEDQATEQLERPTERADE